MKRQPPKTDKRNWIRTAAFALLLVTSCPLIAEAQNSVPTSGNVGIGTMNPTGDTTTVLDIYGSAYSGIFFHTGGSGTSASDGGTLQQSAANTYLYNRETGFMAFGTGNAERMRIDSSGNVGIGTTSPVQKLNVWDTPNDVGLGLFTSGSSVAILGAESGAWKDIDLAFYTQNTTGGNSFSEKMRILHNGNIGIGKPDPTVKLDVLGDMSASGTITGGNINAKYQDVAEWVLSSEQLSAGTVVVLDSTKSNQVVASTQSYDTRVAGVISEQPGIALGEKSDNKVLVATTGRVRVRVDASKSPINIGDLLVTSDIPGVAMKSEPVNIGGVQIHRPGTLIGKALEPLAKGQSKILVLLSLQ
jgi:hypothetical protein